MSVKTTKNRARKLTPKHCSALFFYNYQQGIYCTCIADAVSLKEYLQILYDKHSRKVNLVIKCGEAILPGTKFCAGLGWVCENVFLFLFLSFVVCAKSSHNWDTTAGARRLPHLREFSSMALIPPVTILCCDCTTYSWLLCEPFT